MIPAGNPWQKENQIIATPAQRLLMCQMASADNPKIEVLSIEVDRKGPTYSIDTINELEQRFPEFEFSLILGSDALRNIQTWHRVDELINKVEILQLLRSNEEVILADLPVGIKLKVVKGDMLDISSTMIREKFAKGEDPSELLDFRILEIAKGIYGA